MCVNVKTGTMPLRTMLRVCIDEDHRIKMSFKREYKVVVGKLSLNVLSHKATDLGVCYLSRTMWLSSPTPSVLSPSSGKMTIQRVSTVRLFFLAQYGSI